MRSLNLNVPATYVNPAYAQSGTNIHPDKGFRHAGVAAMGLF